MLLCRRGCSRMRRLALAILMLAPCLCGQTQVESDDLNTLLMHSTFLITGPKTGDAEKTTFGTVFVLGRPLKSEPKRAAYILVTAAHVLGEIDGGTATVQMGRRAKAGT